MTNKKKIFRTASLLLVLCMISTVMISGTFAKYTSEYSGQDTALVARWSFIGNFDDVAITGTNIDLDIWKHAYTTNIYANNGSDYLIAPGIQGEFSVDFTYDADVDADLTFNFSKSGSAASKVPIQYSLDGFDTTIYYDLDDLEDAILNGVAGVDPASRNTVANEAVGTGDGIKTNFDLVNVPTTGSLTVTVDGAPEVNYTLSGKTIIFGTAPANTKAIVANYGYNYYEISETATSGSAISIDKTVSWRWPYDVTLHDNTELLAAGFVPLVGNTWKDADDTRLGNDSKVTDRDEYVLTLDIKATQKVPQ